MHAYVSEETRVTSRRAPSSAEDRLLPVHSFMPYHFYLCTAHFRDSLLLACAHRKQSTGTRAIHTGGNVCCGAHAIIDLHVVEASCVIWHVA